eukprot:637871_1
MHNNPPEKDDCAVWFSSVTPPTVSLSREGWSPLTTVHIPPQDSVISSNKNIFLSKGPRISELKALDQIVCTCDDKPNRILEEIATENVVIKQKSKKKKNKKKKKRPKSAGQSDPRYYRQRYWIWSRYDRGIQMDTVGWYSVTPEPVARVQAERCSSKIILDPFCGLGGNAIQFARTCDFVMAIEKDPKRLAMAAHNSEVYDVRRRIDFILGDSTRMLRGFRQVPDVVFLSPPWGGPDYAKADMFDIKTNVLPDGFELFNDCRAITPNICYFLPRNIDWDQARSLTLGELAEIHEHRVEHFVKVISVYYGQLAQAETSFSSFGANLQSFREIKSDPE